MFQFPLNPVAGQTFNPIPGVSYKWDGFGWVPLALDTGIIHGTQAFTSDGFFTVPLGITNLWVAGAGGGGGGGGATATPNAACGGGGSGAVTIAFYVSASPGQSIACVIGAGGAGGTTTSGAKGGDTIFGATLFLGGGFGGATSTSSIASGGNAGGANGQPGNTGSMPASSLKSSLVATAGQPPGEPAGTERPMFLTVAPLSRMEASAYGVGVVVEHPQASSVARPGAPAGRAS